MIGRMDASTVAMLWQSYGKNLISTAAGGGGSYDLFTPALDAALAQGYATVTAPAPAATGTPPAPMAPGSDTPDSDAPDPAAAF
jgi:hypothetical protein